MSLRPYQIAAIEAVRKARAEGMKRVLVQAATGTGKTTVFSEIAKLTAARGGRTLVLAERQELVEQTAARIESWAGHVVGIEMGDLRALSDDLLERPASIVATVQTLSKRLSKVDPSWPTVLVVDEAHHAVAKSYQTIIDHFADAFTIGFTATPERGDEAALGQVFEDVVSTYPIKQAIDDGYLVPVSQYAVRIEYDLDKIRMTGGDFHQGDLDAVMRQEQLLAAIAQPIIDVGKGRPTIAFCVTVNHAHELARTLNARTGNPNFARGLDGSATREERKEVIDAAKRGDIRVLCNCALFLEGFDWPACEVVAMARPTKSRPLYTQMLGRGTRLSPETGKTKCTVLDYVGNSRHRIVAAFDIFAGQVSEAILDEAMEMLLAGENDRDLDSDDPSVDVMGRLSDAQKRLAQRRFEVQFELIRKDPFAAVGIDVDVISEGPVRHALSEKQAAFLRKSGMEESTIARISRAKASKIIDVLIQRIDKKLCSPKQARALAKQGIDPRNVSFDDASKWMTAIANNRWRLPDAVRLEAPMLKDAVEATA